ncbi:hypothetical protein LC612_41975, partial [Nostoc sp. CHAB 5834]|nr:hypothetical protein [Nostoc sp. CHAB 5834]
FVRPSLMGFAINFSYFDSTKFIGRFNCPKYIRYECEPGSHLFWARSENRDFVEAEVAPDKIYFIEATPQMGGIKAGVRLVVVNPTDQKRMGKILKLLAKKPSESFTQEQVSTDAKELEDAVVRGMEKYKEEKAKGKTNERLERTMFYTVQ